MIFHQGNIRNYLGMTLYYTESGTVKVRIIYYIDKTIAALDKAEPRVREIKTSNAPEYLYKVDKDREKLITDKAKIPHNLVAKNLYTTKKERADTCTAVALLTTRVR